MRWLTNGVPARRDAVLKAGRLAFGIATFAAAAPMASAQTISQTGTQSQAETQPADAQVAVEQPSRPASQQKSAFRHYVVMDNAMPVSRIAPSQTRERKPVTQLAGLQSAPLPDQDTQAPTQTVSTDPSLRPAFFGRQTAFNGDGFLHGSNLESDQAHRQKPSGGLAVDIPVQ